VSNRFRSIDESTIKLKARHVTILVPGKLGYHFAPGLSVVLASDGEFAGIGLALCSPVDMGSRKGGRIKAGGRAVGGLKKGSLLSSALNNNKPEGSWDHALYMHNHKNVDLVVPVHEVPIIEALVATRLLSAASKENATAAVLVKGQSKSPEGMVNPPEYRQVSAVIYHGVEYWRQYGCAGISEVTQTMEDAIFNVQSEPKPVQA